jgi:Ion channel
MKKLPLWIDRLTAGKLVGGSAVILLAFALSYFLATKCGEGILGTYPNAQAASIWDCLYFSVITFSSLGYGDFRPVGLSRVLASLEVFSGLSVLGLAIAKVSSIRQGYYAQRLYSTSCKERLDKFSQGFVDLARASAQAGVNASETFHSIGHYCEGLLNYLKFESENGTFFEDVPMRPVRRLLRYLEAAIKTAMTQLVPGAPPVPIRRQRRVYKNCSALADLLESRSNDEFVKRDCERLRRTIASLAS